MAKESSVVVVAKMFSHVIVRLGPAVGTDGVVWATVGPKGRAPLIESLQLILRAGEDAV